MTDTVTDVAGGVTDIIDTTVPGVTDTVTDVAGGVTDTVTDLVGDLLGGGNSGLRQRQQRAVGQQRLRKQRQLRF